MHGTPFIKMHGLGNDFVVLDARAGTLPLDGAAARRIADRRTGVGCDQLLILERAKTAGADVFMRIRNADGGEVEACGNGARCIAALVLSEHAGDGAGRIRIETAAGVIEAEKAASGSITIDMGPARYEWRDIPLAVAVDTLHVPVGKGPLRDPVCTSMGNPHATFFVADLDAVDLAALGPVLERDPMFPERANIGVAQVLSKERIRLRVWERGVGITQACGTGACAALVAAARRDLAARRAEIVLDGGPLTIHWREDGHVLMTGPTAVSFTGTLDPSLLSG